MAILTTETLRNARNGDVAALWTLHEFCKAQSAKDQSTFTSILDTVLHNFRPELQPRLDGLEAFPDSSKIWMKTVAICTCILADSIDSMFTIPPNPRLAVEAFKTTMPLSPVSCRRLSQTWTTHIWPCISIITKWYILDDMQPAISDSIHQESMNFAVARLLMHLRKRRVGILSRIQNTVGIPACAAGIFLQAVDRGFPHPTLSFTKEMMEVTYEQTPVTISILQNHPSFISSVVAILQAQGSSVDAQFIGLSSIIGTTTSFLEIIRQPSRQMAEKCSGLIDEVMRLSLLLASSLSDLQTEYLAEDDMLRSNMLGTLSRLLYAIVLRGGRYAGRQLIKKHFLQGILYITPRVKPTEQRTILATTSDDKDHCGPYSEQISNILSLLGSSLAAYSMLSPKLHGLSAIDAKHLDHDLLSLSDTSPSYEKLKEAWIEFKNFAASRIMVLQEYKAFELGKNSCCAPTCPREEPNLNATKRRCGGCQSVLYCSRDCQKAHWVQQHKKTCEPQRERSALDSFDSHFLLHQAGFDLQHYSAGMKNIRFDPNDIGFLYCDYRQLPPHFTPQRPNPETMRSLPPAPDPSQIVIVMMMDDVSLTKCSLFGFVSKAVVMDALAGREVERDLGERLVSFGGVLGMDYVPPAPRKRRVH